MYDRLRILQRQPRRISITLSYHVHESLLQRSEEEGRSMSNLCAFLLEDALRHNSQAMLPVNSMTTASPNGDNRLRQRTPF
jgi:macrodomain Ter protein organizer (MatP/YcbG family)